MISLITKEWIINDIEAVLFDKDGTFVDLHFFWGKITEMRSLEVIKRFNLDENLLDNLCLELGYDRASRRMFSDGITALYSRSKIIDIFVERLKKYQVSTTKNEVEKIFDEVSEAFYENFSEYVKPIESAVNFIKKLYSNGVKLGIVTSDSLKSTKLTLRYFDWEYLFDVIVGRESSRFTKESGELTKLAIKELHVDSSKIVMIGDAPMDYISAQNSGVDSTILVSTGQVEKKELEKYSQFCVNSLDEIEVLS